MGIDITLEDENGEELNRVNDNHNKVIKLLPHEGDLSSCCLKFVDPYGDTIFNALQIPFLIKELHNAINLTNDEEAELIGNKIIEMARKHETHTYLIFHGD
jgi:hypothetical protein